MRQAHFPKTLFRNSALLLAAALSMASCIDSSFDLSKDIDLTMGLGGEGLQLKLGTTAQVKLDDLLEADKEKLLGTTADSLYYLSKKGNANFTIHVDPVSLEIDRATLTPEIQVVPPAPAAYVIPQGVIQGVNPGTVATDDFHFNASDVSREVISVKSVKPAASTSAFTLTLQVIGPKSGSIAISEVNNLEIKFPEFLKIKGNKPGEENVVVIGHAAAGGGQLNLGNVELDRVELPGATGMGPDANGNFDLSGAVSMKGDFTLMANENVQMNPGDYVNVRLTIRLNGKTQPNGYTSIVLDEVTGWFDPAINPTVDPVNIAAELPDFLSDEEVTIAVANPTVKFNVDMREIPAGLDVSARLTTDKAGTATQQLDMPASGKKAKLSANTDNVLYFYEDKIHDVKGAFDPDKAQPVGGENAYEVSGLSQLVCSLPDRLEVDMSGGRVKLQDAPFTIRLGHTYHSAVNYDVLIPFNFDEGLKVVYRDSIYDMHEDLKDYAAHGIEATATIAHTIPLDLQVEMEAVDTQGRAIPGIQISQATVDASDGIHEKQGDIRIDITLSDPNALKQLDRLRFRITAEAKNAQGSLHSNQYLQVKDMRLRLKGAVIGDFN